MPFVKGKSGNPGGIAKELAAIKKIARDACPEALQLLVDMSKDILLPARDRAFAAKEILDRGLGRPGQSVELTGAEGKDLAINLVIAQKEVK